MHDSYLQWIVFFRQFNAIGPLFVHLFNIINLNYERPKLTRNAEPRPKQKHRRPELRKHRIPPLAFFTRIFSALCDFFIFFGFQQRVSSSFVSIFYNTMVLKKSQRVPSFTFFGTVTLQKFHFKIFFWKFLKIFSPLTFVIFCNQLEFHKAQRVPLLQF